MEVKKMSEMTMVNFRMDTALKQNMENVCREMGMSMTTAFTIFAAKVSREKRIPFEVNADPFYSAENMAYLSRIAAEIDSEKGQSSLNTSWLRCDVCGCYGMKRLGRTTFTGKRKTKDAETDKFALAGHAAQHL